MRKPSPKPNDFRPLNSWKWMLPSAALPLIALFLFTACGGRDAVHVMTGTQLATNSEILVGAGYIFSYSLALLFSPIFTIAAALILYRDWHLKRRHGQV